MEDAAQNYNLIQDHDWFIKDYYRESGSDNNSAGRVPMALNRPTTWADLKKLGIDQDNDPLVPLKWSQSIIHGMQGFDARLTRSRLEQA